MNSVETTAVLDRVNKAACRILRLYFYLYLITFPTDRAFGTFVLTCVRSFLRRNIKFIGAE